MKAIIITAALASFAAAANEHLQSSGIGCALQDLSVTSDGSITGLLSTVDGTSPSSPGALHSVDVLSGGTKKVQQALDAILEADPYTKPLKLAVMEVLEPLEPADPPKPETKSAKSKEAAAATEVKASEVKTRKVYVVILGKFQP